MILEFLQSNQFASGGLLIVLLSSLLYLCRRWFGVTLQMLRRHIIFELEVRNDSEIYNWISHLMSQKYNLEKRSNKLIAVCSLFRQTSTLDHKTPDILYIPGFGEHFFKYKKSFFLLNKQKEGKDGKDNGSWLSRIEFLKIYTVIWNKSKVLNFIEEAKSFFYADKINQLNVYMVSYNELYHNYSVGRPLSSLYYNDELDKAILRDIKKFLGNSQWYYEKGIPWQRGYLLHGSPGNGKTSLVKALATELSMGIVVINLADKDLTDSSLARILAKCEHNIILFEDIDCIFNNRQASDDNASHITFSGLLNALDGIITGNGRIIFMTTNHREKLDPALIRPGRIDQQIIIEPPNILTIQRMVDDYFPTKTIVEKEHIKCKVALLKSAAEIQEVLLHG